MIRDDYFWLDEDGMFSYVFHFPLKTWQKFGMLRSQMLQSAQGMAFLIIDHFPLKTLLLFLKYI